MKTKFNFELFKQKMLQKVRSSYYDVCTDYFKEIKVHAYDEDLDQIELMTCAIRQMESCSEEQIKKIEESKGIMDVLEVTLFNNTPGNIFFEDEDVITEIMGECYPS
jgi:hypothetical protein